MRVGLARALVTEPEYVLYDEPNAGLDPIMSDTVSELILQLKRRLEVTAVTITHDMKSAYKIADRIAMVYQGRLRAFGTPDEIRASDDPIVQQFIQGHAQGPMSIPGEPG